MASHEMTKWDDFRARLPIWTALTIRGATLTRLSKTLLLTFLSALLFAASLGHAPAAATGNPEILFTSERDGNGEIYVMNADGTNQGNLTNHPAGDWAPDWSPDKTKIVFVSTRDDANGELYVMDANGSNVVRLTNNTVSDSMPAFSPDGTKIAFQSSRSGTALIYTMNTDGTNALRLTTDTTGNPESNPRWSPDGNKIVYSRALSPTHIWVVNSDGTGQAVLAAGRFPDWSPDGTKIAFDDWDGSDWEIYTINPDGSGLTQLTDQLPDGPCCPIPQPPTDMDPDWSPDGTKITFVSTRDGNTNPEIYVMNANGSAQTNLTNAVGSDSSPAWGASAGPLPPPPPPDDIARIAFRSSRLGGDRIFVMNQNGLFIINLSGSNAPEYARELSPAGTKILVASATTGTYQAWTMNPDGSNRFQVTSGSEYQAREWAGNAAIVGERFVNNAKRWDILVVQSDGTGLVNLTNAKGDQFAGDASDLGRVLYFDCAGFGGVQCNIWAINADGSNKRQLTSTGLERARFAQFSPDGTKIAFASERDGNWEIYVMNADGTGQTRLTNNVVSDGLQGFDWSPDGSKIVFVRDSDTYVMNADGSNQVNLSQNPASEDTPTWSPGGTKILFQRNVGGVSQVFIMNADGSSQIQVSDGTANDYPSFWLP